MFRLHGFDAHGTLSDRIVVDGELLSIALGVSTSIRLHRLEGLCVGSAMLRQTVHHEHEGHLLGHAPSRRRCQRHAGQLQDGERGYELPG